MQTVSSIYLEGMGNMVRKPSRMRLTFHYPTGDIVYTNADIVKVTEKKTAHLIAGELPAVELEMELVNLDGSFNPNDISGLHDLIVKGVPVTYEFGYDIPNLQYYGYTDGGEHDYGMEENVPYGFTEGYATEWIPGGEVFTSGEISYSKTTATISAKDYLSFLDEHVLLAYGNRTLAQVAKDVLSLTDYPKEDDGDPKIITGPELDAFNTAITLSETEDDSISAKEHLQTIAHACGVQMYIDRGGYIHLDNDKRGVSAVYSLPLGQQGEAPEHRKEQMPKKVVITLNSEYGDPVETDLNGGGETMTVENPFIVTTAEGETLSEIVYDHFIKYRNTADVPYRGEPALDILDTISLGTEFGGDVEAIVVGTELEFDGTLSGSLSVRYQLGGNTPEKVQIKGSGNFIYPLGEDDEPSITSFNLLCETTFDTPTYQWSYFTVSNGSWLNIAGATSNALTVAYDSSYYNNDSSVKFRCVVNGVKGVITQISKIQLQKSETAGYRGAVVATSPASIDVPSPQIGDVVLLDNTTDGTAEVYGEAHVYNGEEWVATEESDALAMTYKDALQLAEDSGKTIYASEIYADLIVTKRLRVQSGNFLAKINETDGVDVTYGANKLFKVEPMTGKIYFGEHFWYDPSDGAIHTPKDRMMLNANGQFDGNAIQFISTLNAGFLQPWETAMFPNTSQYILDFVYETPAQMANKLDALFTTYASSIRPSFSPSPDMVSDPRNGIILFYCTSENNDTMQLYNSNVGIMEFAMSHYIERYATSNGFNYEIGTVTVIKNGVWEGKPRLYYNNFLSYINAIDEWGFPIDPFRDFTKVRILGITNYTDIIGDLAVHGNIYVKETLLLSGIPTSATGLHSGSVWRDGTTLKIVL